MKLGFIGGGNMAFAIAGGVLASSLCSEKEIFVSDPNPEALKKFKKLGISVKDNNRGALQGDFIILAVKPFILPFVLTELKEKYASEIKDKVFITIAAGVEIAVIKETLGFDAKVIRVMPNTPAMALCGMSVIATEHTPASDEEFAKVLEIFNAIGETELLPESLLNSVIAVTSSSPAYVFMMLEAMADAAVRDGIARNAAYRLAAQSVMGAAKLMLETGKHPGELKDMVCSPRGTTIEAVKRLEEFGFRSAIMSAMQACTEKAESM
ncbi:MAG: pyrroline-5-carboxylate reductase [Ruminococcaceae bacterium]|nr:pyrroline-5-carboxylate reductase [Oscillospiraceae bacterium]